MSRYTKEDRIKRVFKRSKKYALSLAKKVKKLKILKKKVYSSFTRTNRYELLVTPRVFEYYKKSRKCKEEVSYKEWRKLVRAFFKVLRKHVLENEAGVFIKDFGYFFIARNLVLSRKILYDKISGEGRRYTPMFAPIRKDGVLNTWLMDYYPSKSYDVALQKNIEEGVKYKMAYSALYPLFGRQGTNLNLIKK